MIALDMEKSAKQKALRDKLVVHPGGKKGGLTKNNESVADAIDNQLVARFVTGDAQAFDQIVERYKSRIYSYIYYQINQKASDAEDLTQDVFVEFYKQADNYRGESKFSTYLFSVSHNIVLNYFRSQRRRHTDKTDSISHRDFDDDNHGFNDNALVADDSPLDKVINDNLQSKVDSAIEQLKPDERQLLLLTDREGFSYEQISHILSIKVGTVRSRLNAARNRLLQFIKVNKHDM